MVSQTNEQALESSVETYLAWISSKERKTRLTQQLLGTGFAIDIRKTFKDIDLKGI